MIAFRTVASPARFDLVRGKVQLAPIADRPGPRVQTSGAVAFGHILALALDIPVSTGLGVTDQAGKGPGPDSQYGAMPPMASHQADIPAEGPTMAQAHAQYPLASRAHAA